MMNLSRVAQAIALLGLASSGLAFAQTAPAPAPAPKEPQKLEKITITGSSIKRLADQGALPLQVFTRTEIDQLGVQTAEQLLDLISANAANVDNATSRNNVFGAEQDRLTGGSSFANLRGLGPTGTLVLLNGRRVSTHGMSGGSVDLNAIPMDAVERVETLKDGASAIYGTDAIGGVINFILKSNYQGLSIRANLSQPMENSAGTTRRVSITGGTGDIDAQGFNVMASLTWDKNDILRGIDRSWATGFQPELGLSPDTTSAPHANIIASTGTALTSAGTLVGTTDTTRYTNLNLLAIRGQCDQLPFGVAMAPNITLWDKFGYTKANSQYRCATDYGRQFMLAPPKDALNALLRGSFDLGDGHRGAVEVVASRTEVQAEFTPYQFSTSSNAVTNLQTSSPYYLDMRALVGAQQFDPTKPIAYRLRMWDWGYRTIKNTSENLRANVTFDGTLWDYDYRAGIGYGTAEGYSDMLDGYADTNKLIALLASGKYNPFLLPGQEQTAEAKALIEDSKVRGRLFGGKTSVLQADAALSGKLMDLPWAGAGSLDFAVGTDLRQESYEFSGSQNYTCVSTFSVANAALPNSVMGCPGNSSAKDTTRDIAAVYAELQAQVAKSLELTFQIRHDRYSQVGNTTNPKLGFKFQPMGELLVRGSVNTGFRAPTPQQLRLGSAELALTGVFRDPVLCADVNNPQDATQCQRNSLPYRTGGNPTLKPEESKQGTLGFVFAPNRNLQIYADYWQVQLDDRIRSLSPTFMITNYDLFKDNFIRDANGVVQYIQAGWVNAAESKTKGVDFGITFDDVVGDGRMTASLNGTRMISHKERLIETAPLQEYVGEWTSTTLYLPWKLSGSLGYRMGPVNATVSVNYKSGYKDEDMSAYSSNIPRRDVSSYTTYNLFATYTGIKGVTLTGGIINLLDTDPPFTYHNVDGVVGAGWDPRVANPRGRTVQISATWSM